MLIVVVQERHEEPTRLAVRTNDAALHFFAMVEHLNDFSGRDQSFRHAGQPEKKREVQSSVHADQIGVLGGMAANETRDLLLVVIHFSEAEKVLLTDTQCKLTHRIAKHLR